MINTKEEFLVDTLKYYCEDSSRRCVDKNNTCFYSPVNINSNSDGCAIGRHLEKEVKGYLDSVWKNSINSLEDKNYELLPEWMRALGKEYLSRIQRLHDSPVTWNSTGLSYYGKKLVKNIISDFNLDESKLVEAKRYYETSNDESGLVEST